MAWQDTHKAQSKDRILTSAAMLFTHHGFEKISIDQVMKNAELTRGAFYSHFKSKSDRNNLKDFFQNLIYLRNNVNECCI